MQFQGGLSDPDCPPRRGGAIGRRRQAAPDPARARTQRLEDDRRRHARRCRHRRRRAPRPGRDRRSAPRRRAAMPPRSSRSSPSWSRCTSARPGCRSSRSARARSSAATSAARSTRCATSPASSTCTRTRRSSWRGRSCARPADYLDNLLPPFFKALAHHAERSAYSWHTPGHAGGVGFLKSPVGHALHAFFGENTLRSDLSISVPELGSLLDHTGPVKAAEAYAAKVFGADHTYFVTNGTSTANKVVWHSMAGQRRPRDRRSQLPQVAAAHPDHDRRDADLLHAGAQRLRNHRADRPRPVLARGDQEEDRRQPDRARQQGQRAHRRGHQFDLRRALLQRREDQGAGGRPGRRAALRRGLVRLRRVPRVLPGPPRDGRAARLSARRPHAGVRHPLDAQAAGGVLAGLDDPHPGVRQAEDRHHPLQRRVHDARLDLAALRDHRLARRQLGDDGRPRPAARSCRRRTTRR